MRKIFKIAEINDVVSAQQILKRNEEKNAKRKKGFYVSIAASILWFLFWYVVYDGKPSKLPEIFYYIWIVLGLALTVASYILCGSFKEFLKITGSLALIGWYIVPFPFDLMTIIFTVYFSLIASFFFPVIIIAISYYLSRKESRAAKEYIDTYKTLNLSNDEKMSRG